MHMLASSRTSGTRWWWSRCICPQGPPESTKKINKVPCSCFKGLLQLSWWELECCWNQISWQSIQKFCVYNYLKNTNVNLIVELDKKVSSAFCLWGLYEILRLRSIQELLRCEPHPLGTMTVCTNVGTDRHHLSYRGQYWSVTKNGHCCLSLDKIFFFWELLPQETFSKIHLT